MKSSVLGRGPSGGRVTGDAGREHGAGGDGGAEPAYGVVTPCANLRCANTLRLLSSGDSGDGALGVRARTVSRLERGMAASLIGGRQRWSDWGRECGKNHCFPSNQVD